LTFRKDFYVPSFSKNLISISKLTPFRFTIIFYDLGFSLSNKSKIIDFG